MWSTGSESKSVSMSEMVAEVIWAPIAAVQGPGQCVVDWSSWSVAGQLAELVAGKV